MDRDPISIAIRFNDRINARDLEGLVDLMTKGHRFIDSAGNQIEGRDPARAAWEGFFRAWPDYRNTFSQVIVRDELVIMVGRSSCSQPLLDGPAIWSAKIAGDGIAEWRVWEDSPETRRALDLP